jgi:tyrosinase
MLKQRSTIGRRGFIASAGAASAVAVGHDLFLPQPASAAVVRRDVLTLPASDPIIASYKNAITAMKALSVSNPNDPRGWTYQAGIHGSFAPPKPQWNTCEHGTYWFWPWHRMYLYWFERIIRKYSYNPGWSLPYWNYSASAAARSLPAVFRIPGNTSNQLWVSARNASINAGSPMPASAVGTGGLSALAFVNASSNLEGTPHGAVHVSIGGWMGSVPTAAQDPIFYLHHANIDRLWNIWLAQGGGRSDPLGDATWKNRVFTFFNENGTAVNMTSCDVLRAALQLNYTYQGEPPQVNQYCRNIFICCIIFVPITVFQLRPIELGSGVTTTKIDLKQYMERLNAVSSTKSQVLLQLDDIVTEKQPGVYWEVYFGPGDAKPDPEGPYYVGNVAVFGAGVRSEAHHEFHPARVSLPINAALRSARQSNTADFVLTFVPRSGDPKATEAVAQSPVRIGRVSLGIETQESKPR